VAVDAAAHIPSGAADDGILITRERHRAGLLAALAELTEFLMVWEQGALPAPVAAVHLYAARESLTELIGIIDTEDVLDRVFRDFCIGK
jgi:tRNA modification GTPase